jgi:hypothetical protein
MLANCEFHDNQYSGGRNLLNGVYEIVPIFSAFIM